MLCPFCQQENIEGVDSCRQCGQSLVNQSPEGSEVEQALSGQCIAVLEPRAPFTISPTATVREAVDVLVTRKVGSLLVEQEGELVGIFTERDLLNKVGDRLDEPVNNFMTSNPQTITLEDSLAYALHCMKLGSYRHLPVVNTLGQPIGIISVRDIFQYLYANYAESPV